MDSWLVSIFWLPWIMLLWTLVGFFFQYNEVFKKKPTKNLWLPCFLTASIPQWLRTSIYSAQELWREGYEFSSQVWRTIQGLIGEKPFTRPFFQVAADMHTSQKHLTYFYRHDCPLPGPTSECVFSWRFQILLSKQFICQQDRCCQKHFCTFQEQSRGERNLREFSYCQLHLSLNSVSAMVITYTSLVLGTKGAQIFEQWSPAVDTLSANVLRDDCPAHH